MTLFKPFATKLAPLFSKPHHTNKDSFFYSWTGHKISYKHGARFFIGDKNLVASYADFDKLVETVDKCSSSSVGAGQLQAILGNPHLKQQLAVMARLSPYVSQSLTVKQKISKLVETIDDISCNVNKVKSGELLVSDLLDRIDITDNVRKL